MSRDEKGTGQKRSLLKFWQKLLDQYQVTAEGQHAYEGEGNEKQSL